MLNYLIEQTILWIKISFFLFVGIVKACLPKGILPKKSVKGEVVLITGAGSGVGRLMAIEELTIPGVTKVFLIAKIKLDVTQLKASFAKLGATLVLWDVNEKGNKETAKEVTNLGAKVTAHTVDLSKKDQIAKKAQAVKDEFGHVDILINNAGVVSGKLLLDCTDEQIERTMAVNATCHFWTTRAFLSSMLERNHGHIVTIASIAGKLGAAKVVDYCASKHAAVGFHEALKSELQYLRKDGVHTTVVCPWFIETGMFEGFACNNTWVLPPLQPEYVVECTVEAILTNAHQIALPRFSYVLAAAMQLLPVSVLQTFNTALGSDTCMENFRGRNGSPARVANGKSQ